jgi:hypothetical protein
MAESPKQRDDAVGSELGRGEPSTSQALVESASATGQAARGNPRSIEGASLVEFTPATPREQRTGLLGYVRLSYGDLVLDGLTLRRTASGSLSVSYPSRRDRQGGRHPYFEPADPAKRADFERWFLEVCKRSGGDL